MTATFGPRVTATLPPYLSGWCGQRNHTRCRGLYSGTDCQCPCHRTCEHCGQALPEAKQ